ncbi:hypothetical protein [Sphingomonas sp. VNH70]|uniref:hypothetical protein n=1 Tax=Sphingomonas silueang TaxID=3156617 RepID=UPI0032B5F91D
MRGLLLGAALLLGGCTMARMDGFDAIAPAQGERLDLSGIPLWENGSFRLGLSQGHVRRRDIGATREWSDDPWGELSAAVIERTGTIAFDLAGPEVGGRIEGRCRYGRVEGEVRGGILTSGTVLRPLRLACAYRLDGRDAGGMDLAALLPVEPTVAEPRLGTIELDGTELTLRSSHRIAGVRSPTGTPIGYFVDRADGQTVGAIETNGLGNRRLIVPQATGERRAAIAAMVTLALFRDPGDTD